MSTNNSSRKIIQFAALVCLVCALLVSMSAVALRGIQEQNKLNEKRFNILLAAGLAESGKRLSSKEIDALYQNIKPIVVDLKTGQLVENIDANQYDMYAAAKINSSSEALQNDPASIKRIAHHANAYLLMKDGQVERVVLPVQGYGLWSTLYGFLALDIQNQSIQIKGITFHQHAETPGLGGEVSNPAWQAKWLDKIPYDAAGKPHIHLKKSGGSASNEIDSLSGATLTSRGVENLINFWLGEQGFKPFIQQLQNGNIKF